MKITVLDVDTVPTLGNILGTSVDSFIVDSINNAIQTTTSAVSNISSFIEDARKKFINNIVEPIKKNFGIYKKINLDDVNKILPIISEEDLFNIPPAMHLPILMYEPIKELLKQERIEGWGYEYNNLPKEDVYGRLIDNGKIEDVMTNLKEEKIGKETKHYIEFNYKWNSEDPDLDFDEIDYIEQTRKFLDEFLKSSRLDPTNPAKLRG